MRLNLLLTLMFGIIRMILNSNVYKNYQDSLPYGFLFIQLLIWIVYGFLLFPINHALLLFVYILTCILTLIFTFFGEVVSCCTVFLGTIKWSFILFFISHDTQQNFIVKKLLSEELVKVFRRGDLVTILTKEEFGEIIVGCFFFLILIPMFWTLVTIEELKTTGLGKLDITLTMGLLTFLGLIISDLILSIFFDLNSVLAV